MDEKMNERGRGDRQEGRKNGWENRREAGKKGYMHGKQEMGRKGEVWGGEKEEVGKQEKEEGC